MQKQLKDIGLQITEQEYRDLDNISYSFLSGINKYGSNQVNIKFKPTPASKFGLVTEDLIFDMFSLDKYIIKTPPFPGDVLRKAIDDIVEKLDNLDGTIGNLKAKFFNLLEADTDKNIGFWDKKDSEWRVEKMFKDGYDYIMFLIEDSDKIIISPEAFVKAKECNYTLRNHEFTKDIFSSTEPHMEGVAQFKGKFNYKYGLNASETIEIKFMVDWLLIDHKAKKIHIYDLKTGGAYPTEFENNLFFWRYDIQAYLYTLGVHQFLQKEYPDYRVNALQFIYISSNQTDRVLKYALTKDLFHTVPIGYQKQGKSYKGVNDLIKEYQWYLRHSFNVQFDEKVYDMKGLCMIGETNTLRKFD